MPRQAVPLPVVPAASDVVDDVRSVCHDLSGHLVTVAVTLSALLARDDVPAPVARQLAGLLPEVGAAAEMVRRVSTHERRVGVFDLSPVLVDAVDRAQRRRAHLGEAATVVDLAVEPVLVRGDALEAARMAGNLVDNALRAAGPGGRVAVRLSEQLRPAPGGGAVERQAVLVVEDSGPGFGLAPPGVASLGLHVVRAVIADLHATMRVGRSSRGGARVEVTLPVQRT